ncbi:TOMM precursor leader peptide-binding protein [Sphaerimonospora sp. CA-214678]|uniref:TOMM precursor leader peptide-binding protein n=1 Tax=Sphaerimonospora sp. CA-214678 TaxID=3240029 RepID=UPI003D943C2B
MKSSTVVLPAERACEDIEKYLASRLAAYTSAAMPRIEPPRVELLGFRDLLDIQPSPSVSGTPIYLTPRSVMLGPTPREVGSPCHWCVALRWQKLRGKAEREILEGDREVRTAARTPFLTQFTLDAIWALFSQLARRAAGRQAGSSPPGIGEVYELSLDSLQAQRYALLADPSCRVCGPAPADGSAAPVIEFVSRVKKSPGRYRIRSVEELDLPMAALANPVCGALGSMARPDLSCPTTAPVNGNMTLRISAALFDVSWGGHADSYEASSRLGVLEGLERYAGGQRRGNVEPVFGSYAQLRDNALDPRECGMYREEVYRNEPGLREFDEERAIPWVWGYSLRDERPILVPERIAYYMGKHGGEDSFVYECSNGCASGSCLEEAVLFGLLELLERDAFLLAWYGKACLPEIDLDSCVDSETRFMIDRLRLWGYDTRLFDNRVDSPIPVVSGVAVRRDGGLGRLCFAAGSSLDPEAAVRAALCEIASYVPALPKRVADRLPELRTMAKDFSKVGDINDHATLFGLPEMARHADFLLLDRPKIEMADLYREWEQERPRTHDFMDDLRYCRDLITEAGHDLIIVDQTCPEQRTLGLRTVSVIVPGLIPIDFGWSKQRVLTLPRMRTAFRRAGWIGRDLLDSDLHYVPHPFP